MKYMGSKARIAKHILPIILKDRKEDQIYIEPFVGGCNLIDKVTGIRLANDNNKYLISMWNELIYNNWNPPQFVSEQKYKEIQNNKENYPDHLIAYVGFNSYGGKFFGGYCRDSEGKRDYWLEHYNHIQKQIPKLEGVVFLNREYSKLRIPQNSIIYCDPPYANTTKYNSDFNSNNFWNWIRKISKENKVFVSEYNAPDDFECIWKMQINNTLVKNTGDKTGVERLFTAKR